jgi:hypothetical protein
MLKDVEEEEGLLGYFGAFYIGQVAFFFPSIFG